MTDPVEETDERDGSVINESLDTSLNRMLDHYLEHPEEIEAHILGSSKLGFFSNTGLEFTVGTGASACAKRACLVLGGGGNLVSGIRLVDLSVEQVRPARRVMVVAEPVFSNISHGSNTADSKEKEIEKQKKLAQKAQNKAQQKQMRRK